MNRHVAIMFSAALLLGVASCSGEAPEAAPELAVEATPDAQGRSNAVRASINTSLVGSWNGAVTSSNYPVAGAQVGAPVRLTFAVTSEDRLDTAYWGDAIGLTWIEYIDPEHRRVRSWTPDGAMSETNPRIHDIVEPDSAGAWSFSQTIVDGAGMALLTTFSLQGDTLTVVAKQRREGSADPFVETQTLTLNRSPVPTTD